MDNVSNNIVGGRLKFFVPFWQSITSDSFILNCIKGVQIEFQSSFQQTRIPNQIKCSALEKEKIDCIIDRFISSCIIEEVDHCEGEFISNIFPVAKRNGDIRIILNLKPLNTHVSYEHFKMEHLSMALGLMEDNFFMASIDLKDAYYSVSVNSSFRKYLRFVWNGKLYQFTCLAQGLSCAPRIFTKIMKPIFSKLRSEGFLSVFYLDDSLLLGRNEVECTQNVSSTKNLLQKAGFIVNEDKSCFTPSKEITFLGFCLNSDKMTISLPADKKIKIVNTCTRLLNESIFLIRDVASFIGLLVSSLPAVQYGGLFYKYLEMCKVNALKISRGNFDAHMTLDYQSKCEIEWWKENVMNSFQIVRVPPPTIIISTDASLDGWGCSYGVETTGGQWNIEESSLHINVLELKAILFSLKSYFNNLSCVHVRIKSDNSTAVHYVNNLGGVKSLSCHKVAKDIWLWAMQRCIHLSAEHLPGTENTQADKASRIFDVNTEWQLSQIVFDKIVHVFGPFDIDLFASRLNAKCQCYCSWKPDPSAFFIDAFSACWKDYSKPYIFSPFSVIMKCLQKVCLDQAQVVLIAPLWITQPWFPKMMRMLIESPIVLPLDVLSLPFKKEAVHKQHKNLRLIACHLSGNSIESNNFRSKLQMLCVPPGEEPPNFNMKYILRSGLISVVEGRLIPCNIMK